jgi:hypothetical protein
LKDHLNLSRPSPPSGIAPSVESGWTLAGEDLGASSLGNTVRKREFEVLGKKLLDVWALDVVGLLNLDDLENLWKFRKHDWTKLGCDRKTYVDGTETRSVPRSHILVQSLDRICSRHLTVLLVHVVGAGTGIVTDPDTEVLDLERALLVDLKILC